MPRTMLMAGLLLLAGCSESKPPAEKAAPDTPAYNAVDPTPDLRAGGATAGAAGTWTAGALPEGPAAIFISGEAEPLFSILCDDQGGILLQRHLEDAETPAEVMELRSGSEVRALDVALVRSVPPALRGSLPFADSFISVLRQGEAPLHVSAPGMPPLVLPHNPMIGEFIGDCVRRSSAA